MHLEASAFGWRQRRQRRRRRHSARAARAQPERNAPERALYQHTNTDIFRIPHRAHTRLANFLCTGGEAAKRNTNNQQITNQALGQTAAKQLRYFGDFGENVDFVENPGISTKTMISMEFHGFP